MKYLLLVLLLLTNIGHAATSNLNFTSLGVGGGMAGSDWIQYTPTFTGFGTVSVQSFWYRRVGDSYEIQGKFTSGTSTATQAQITLPSGTIDSTKVPAIRAGGTYFLGGSSVSFKGGSVLVTGGNAFINLGQSNTFSGSSVDPLVAENGNNISTSGNIISISVTVPITGFTAGGPAVTTKFVSVRLAGPSGGSCAVSQELGGDWVSGTPSSAAAGKCLITFTSGFFASAPNCTCTGINVNTTAGRVCQGDTSSTTFDHNINDAAGSGQNTDRFIICHGN